jgi:hypothetical protein
VALCHDADADDGDDTFVVGTAHSDGWSSGAELVNIQARL